jgi:hypothetical protein
MITRVVQRWRDRRGTYRPVGEVLEPLHYEVAAKRLCRPIFHSGNHRYLFALDGRLRRHLPKGLPYPKFTGTHA